jgi:hypothetical protein
MSYKILMLFVFPLSFLAAFLSFKLSCYAGDSSKSDSLMRYSCSAFTFFAVFNIVVFTAHMLGVSFPSGITRNLTDYPWAGSAHLAIAATFFYVAKSGITSPQR